MSELPTPEQMLSRAEADLNDAYRSLSDAADWLLSDWRPGTQLTTGQAERRARMFAGIAEAKAAINRAKGGSDG